MPMKFRAHDTFFIRKGWLSKGMRCVSNKPDVFISHDENPMDVLGIGANMVKALRYWLQAVGLTEEPTTGKRTQRFTDLGKLIYQHDTYIEELGTLCLLQYCLASQEDEATAWYFFFNEFSMSEFSREDFVSALQKYIKMRDSETDYAIRSLNEDFQCIINTARIAVSRAKTYDVDLVDTIGDAFVGLLTAIDRYDPDHSGPFISFASLWIYQNISREQSTRNPCIYFPVHRKEWFYTMYPLLKARECTECGDVLKCNKVIEMICQKVQCTQDQAADVLTASLPNLSWEEIIDSDMDYQEQSCSNEDIVGDVEGQDRGKVIREILNKLTDRERAVLIDRYGLDDNVEKTLEQVGQKLGITRERVRQIEVKAFRKLRHPSRSKKLKEFLN